MNLGFAPGAVGSRGGWAAAGALVALLAGDRRRVGGYFWGIKHSLEPRRMSFGPWPCRGFLCQLGTAAASEANLAGTFTGCKLEGELKPGC